MVSRSPFDIDVKYRGKDGKKFVITVNEGCSVAELKALIKKKRGLHPNRQRITIPLQDPKARPVVLEDEKYLEKDYSLRPEGTANAVLELKDLGPQIGYSTVFFWEYFGPLIVYLFFFLRPSFVYGAGQSVLEQSTLQKIAGACWIFHYTKRIFETFFVHRFSKGTMPILNLFKNCSYYWMAGALVGYFLNHPLYTPPADITVSIFGKPTLITAEARVYVGLAIFVISEFLNFVVHWQLRNLRPPGTRVRAIPRGILFSLVSCPNYTFEILAWAGFNIMTQTAGGVMFMIVGALQMAIWAKQKHKSYRRDFKDYPRIRKAVFPLIL
mmetsp:Transcript_39628/g.64244  ORF Transcript_39628/g.64244 Transcript_39628/m.64244 type:complete len:326 (+) Transcript_39628:140-1117(+)|eukprot:CAMPEP_0184645592 /NCGR_PEP_ID=MMETSP0308-20130426/2106_1 /TAXON_ID=38269 /ORGANISM="Gloeochaete witrockiana, Strain SAG 46.84" /LENGTH=325 /DNA_ID=CAMNT_0027074773 /DNA_START=130 /DNA_END=1107 /DNA_ORIENTATION=+